jgi:DNA-binding NarL/FixJ family response regulator
VPALRLLIVDDHRLIAETLAALLGRQPEFDVAGIAATAPEGLALARRLRPAVVLMDIGLPGMDGVEATWTLRRTMPEVRVLVLTMFDQEPYVLEALRAGAMGYLLKTATVQQLYEAVHAAAAGQRVLDPRLPPDALQRASAPRLAARGPYPLSRRETEVVQRVAGGCAVAQIARELHLSEHTVRNHLKAAYRKLGVHSRAEAAVHALRRGLALA